MSRFDERVKRDLGQIADRATPSSGAWDAIQFRIAEQAEQPETEIIMLDKNPNPPRRSRTTAWILTAAAAVVLIVGGVIVLHRNDDDPAAVFAGDDTTLPDTTLPDTTLPDTGLDPDTEDPAGGELVEADPTVMVDGDGCTYVGPESFVAGSEVTFTFVLADEAESLQAGFSVWAVGSAVTAQEILERGILNRGSQVPESRPAESTETEFRVTYELSDPGRYAVNCASRPEGGPAVDYATIFTVIE